MTEHRSSTGINKESHSESLDRYVKDLLDQPTDSGEFAGMTETEQALAIMDRFVGALVRRGDIVDSHGQVHNAETTLKSMSQLRAMEDVHNITRTGGLRGAVIQLAEDTRTVQLFSSAYGGAIMKDESGSMLLRNEDQLQGYLHGGANNRVSNPVGGVNLPGSQWVGVLEERIEMVLERNGQWIFNPRKGIIESDNDYLRQEGNKWRMAVASAEKVGVDPSLVGRSVEAIDAKHRAERKAMGNSALNQTVERNR